jgi:hypothetical protein
MLCKAFGGDFIYGASRYPIGKFALSHAPVLPGQDCQAFRDAVAAWTKKFCGHTLRVESVVTHEWGFSVSGNGFHLSYSDASAWVNSSEQKA